MVDVAKKEIRGSKGELHAHPTKTSERTSEGKKKQKRSLVRRSACSATQLMPDEELSRESFFW